MFLKRASLMTVCNCTLYHNKHKQITDIGEGDHCVNDDREMLRKFADRFNLEHNILYLQAILMKFSSTCSGSQSVVEICRRYAETKSSVLYLVKDEKPPGTVLE